MRPGPGPAPGRGGDAGGQSGGDDRLAEALRSLRMQSTFYSHADLRAPWALEVPAFPDTISFHVVSAGAAWLRCGATEPVDMSAGDIALVPHGLGHDLLSDPNVGPAVRVDRLPQRYSGECYSHLTYGGDGRATQLICGIVSFDDPAARELMRRLPALLQVRGDAASTSSAIRDTVRLMAGELARPQPGAETVATRLADVLVVQAIREWLANDEDARSGWLQALRDEQIGRALAAMHAEPGRGWSLDSLARTAALSRSTFTARFTTQVGEPPMAYLTRWRMNLAFDRLRRGDVTAGRLAAELGYQSEAAFSRAFTRTLGRTPGSVRRELVSR